MFRLADGWGSGSSETRPMKRDQSTVMKHKTTGSKNRIRKRFFKFRVSDVPKLRLVRSSILKGYPPGSIINLVSVPKAGKTTFALQEVMLASVLGGESLYMINESTKDRFQQIIKRHARELAITEKDVGRVMFCDMVDESISVPQYGAIESYMVRVWCGTIEHWLTRVKNPQFIVIDSFSEIVRKYIPQAYVAMKYFVDGLNSVMIKHKKYPAVICVNQKSGGKWERDDESVLGGYGIVHKTDASVVLRIRHVDKWDADRYGLDIGSIVHTIQTVEMRDVDVDSQEHILVKKDGALQIGPTFSELSAKVEKLRGAENGKTGTWTGGRT